MDVFAQTSSEILLPTDDAYVATDLANPDDPISELNTGNMTWQKIGYSFNSTKIESNLISFGYIKFDLSQLNPDDILSATLNMNSIRNTLVNNTVVIFKTETQDWEESSISFKTKPFFNQVPIDVINNISPTNWIQWNVTDTIKQNNSTYITFVITLYEFKQNFEEDIVLYSKESTIPDTQPFLEIEFIKPAQKIESSENTSSINDNDFIIVELPVTEDAFVGANYANLQSFENMRNTNTGNLNFTKIWYAYNATGTGDFFISSGFLKFDISELNLEHIISAELKMYDILVNPSGANSLISVFTVDNTTWTESELTFNNKPDLVEKIAITQIDNVHNWTSWDVTDAIKQSIDSELTLSITFDEFLPNHEEEIIFNSKESLENHPYLEIVYDGVDVEGGGCLIATATYGSELAPQVQQLRELRDNYLLPTESGTAFMAGFNSIYYSFSPVIADLERTNSLFRELVKITITPMISSLSILHYVNLDSEYSVLGYGLSIVMLNIGMYFVSPVIGLKIAKKCLLNNRHR